MICLILLCFICFADICAVTICIVFLTVKNCDLNIVEIYLKQPTTHSRRDEIDAATNDNHDNTMNSYCHR